MLRLDRVFKIRICRLVRGEETGSITCPDVKVSSAFRSRVFELRCVNVVLLLKGFTLVRLAKSLKNSRVTRLAKVRSGYCGDSAASPVGAEDL